jgi:DNA-binding MurR/RpiR family transcriptional regulator
MLADRIRSKAPDLPPQLRAAAAHLAAHPFEAATRSMRAMAAECGASPASFSRLAQALGFAGWEALREAAIAESRRAAPYSTRAARPLPGAVAEADRANLAALAALPAAAIEAAAAALHGARRVHVAGFRSCRAVAVLLHYQLSLFRADVSLVGDAALDLDLGAMRRGEALALIGFKPYSRAGLAALGAARAAGLATVVLADDAAAPIAAGADHLLLFPTATPAFFPSLTAAVALAQALAAATYRRGGRAALARLRASEARLDAIAAYVPQPEEP